MKVLMFGWEYPPHISGGLGTACFGLTHSLIQAKVKVLFVVPRLFPDQENAGSFLIDASDIAARFQNDPLRPKGFSADAHADIKHSRQQGLSGAEHIHVASSLSPYQNEQSYQKSTLIESWNFSFENEKKPGEGDVSFAGTSSDTQASLFSGTYGKNLMEEVSRYAEVGEVIANETSFDIVHAHDWMTFPAGIAAKRVSKKPLIVHVHSTEVDRAGENINKHIFEIEHLGFRHADQIIAVSDWTMQIVMSRYNVPSGKIRIIYNGVSPKQHNSDFYFPRIASHFVTFLGRVTYQKGPKYFVEAASLVLEQYPKAHFIVAGAGDLLPQMIERVAQLNMSSNFHFTGFIRDRQIDQIWALSNVYVMPSVSEPFGITSLEAIQGGVPVILSNQSGVSEVMPHAIKVDFWNTKALAAAICSVLRYESLSNVLTQNSRRQIQQLTWDKAAIHVKALYDDLIGQQKK